MGDEFIKNLEKNFGVELDSPRYRYLAGLTQEQRKQFEQEFFIYCTHRLVIPSQFRMNFMEFSSHKSKLNYLWEGIDGNIR